MQSARSREAAAAAAAARNVGTPQFNLPDADQNRRRPAPRLSLLWAGSFNAQLHWLLLLLLNVVKSMHVLLLSYRQKIDKFCKGTGGGFLPYAYTGSEEVSER
eukprot:5004989-Amphidinium_carterae.1